MAHYQEEYGQTDEYGHPIRQSVDEYVNPIHHSAGTTGGYGTAGHGTAPPQPAGTHGGAAVVGTDTVREYHGLSGKLHRSGSSSSSSSSEDDGQGGRRKKGVKEKVKEKLPGHRDRSQATPTTTPGGSSAKQHREKKGIIDNIKEKLPGHHHDH